MENREKVNLRLLMLLIVTIIISILYSKYMKSSSLKMNGLLIEAVIIDGRKGYRGNYRYVSCTGVKIESSFRDRAQYKPFIYGDKITIMYLPYNPNINKPIYMLYKNNPEIRKKYEKEFLKKLNKDEPINEYWRGWNDILYYQQMFPIHSEYPCLPPWY